MSIGPAPNLSGGIGLLTPHCCTNALDGGNGFLALGPSGAFAPSCNCNTNDCCSDNCSGGQCNNCPPGQDCNSCPPGQNCNTCGDGNSAWNTVYGAGPAKSPPPSGKICWYGGLPYWDMCTCMFVFPPGDPVNAPAGTFLPNPLTGTSGFNFPVAPPCAQTLPPVPIGGITPPAVPGPTSPISQGVEIEDQIPHFVSGLPVTCAQSGVTQTATCTSGGMLFYQPDPNTKHYSTPGGAGTDCSGMGGHIYSSGSGGVAGIGLLVLFVTRQ